MARPFESELAARRHHPFANSLNEGAQPHLYSGATGASLGWAESVGRPELEPLERSFASEEDDDVRAQFVLGSYQGFGPRIELSDQRLREMICERLTEDEYVDPSDVSVSGEAGEVTLEGTVPQRFMKYRIEDVVDSFSGVKEIHNHIATTAGVEMNDLLY